MDIYLAPHALVVAAQTIRIGQTRRPAAVLLWSASGRPMEIGIAGKREVYRGRAALLAPHVARTLRAEDCGLLSVNFEPGHPYYLPLSEAVGSGGLLPLAPRKIKAFEMWIERLFEARASLDDVDDMLCPIAEAVLGKTSANGEDPRVRWVIECIEASLRNPPSLPYLAHSVRLSENRLSHLFVEQMGVPLRSYIVWRRYRRALQALHGNGHLADVAQDMGFSDQAHMSRTFRGFFAYQPSRLRSAKVAHIHAHTANVG